MDEPVKTGHVYPAGCAVFVGSEDETVYRARNALLVKALRSGNFVQARGTLEAVRHIGYRVETIGNCCLGVACRVAAAEADSFSVITRAGGGGYSFGTASSNDVGETVYSSMMGGYPPPLVARWFGWDGGNPVLWLEDNTSFSAAYLNDSYEMGFDFDRIADAFERTFVTFTRRSVDDLTALQRQLFQISPE